MSLISKIGMKAVPVRPCELIEIDPETMEAIKLEDVIKEG